MSFGQKNLIQKFVEGYFADLQMLEDVYDTKVLSRFFICHMPEVFAVPEHEPDKWRLRVRARHC